MAVCTEWLKAVSLIARLELFRFVLLVACIIDVGEIRFRLQGYDLQTIRDLPGQPIHEPNAGC